MHRYELTDYEWERISKYFPEKEAGTPGRPPKPHRPMVNGIVWIARSGAPWRDLPERYGPWESVYSRFQGLVNNGILAQMFRDLSIDADLQDLSLDSTSVKVHQHAAGAKKRGPSAEIGRSGGGLTTKIHAVVDALGNPVHLLLSAGNQADVTSAPPLVCTLDVKGSLVLLK